MEKHKGTLVHKDPACRYPHVMPSDERVQQRTATEQVIEPAMSRRHFRMGRRCKYIRNNEICPHG